MPKATEIQIFKKIQKAKRGSLFFNENFLDLGTEKTVGKALERLAAAGKLVRVARGIYVHPEQDPVIGAVTPSLETIAKAIARRDKARIIPSGMYALNRLGLSTQVPLNVVYLTNGSARKVVIGKRSITFKKSSPKNVAAIGEISGLAIQALKKIGKDKVTQLEIEKILQLLQKEKINHLQHDLRLAPVWIRVIFQTAIKTMNHEKYILAGVAETTHTDQAEHLY